MATYQIVNGAGDGLGKVDAKSAKEALKIWKTKYWHRAPNARGVKAVKQNPARRKKKRTAAQIAATKRMIAANKKAKRANGPAAKAKKKAKRKSTRVNSAKPRPKTKTRKTAAHKTAKRKPAKRKATRHNSADKIKTWIGDAPGGGKCLYIKV